VPAPESAWDTLKTGWDYLRVVFTIHWFGFLWYTLIVFFAPEKEFARLTGSPDPSQAGLELMYFVGGLRLFIQVVLAYTIVVNQRHLRWATVLGMMTFEAVFLTRFIAQSGFGAIGRYWPPLLFLVAYSVWIGMKLWRRSRSISSGH
jgi:hypothetical protein